MREPKFAEEGRHECDNCGKVWPAAKLQDVEDFSMRVEAGGTIPSGECPECGALCYPVKKPQPSKPAIYLLVNAGGVDLQIVSGPFASAAALEDALIQFAGSDHYDRQEDTVHSLEIKDGTPKVGSFTNGYMENVLWVAAGCAPVAKPDTWDEEAFELITKKKIERRFKL